MNRYRRKSVVVEAMRFVGTTEQENPTGPGTIQAWCRALFFDGGGGSPRVQTPAGLLAVSDGDWIVKDAQGFYPCKPDIFDATYDPA